MKIKLYAFTLIAAIASSNSLAGIGNDFSYVGVGAQYNEFKDLDFTPEVEDNGYAPLTLSDDTSGFGTRFFFGHHFGQYLAFEAGATFFNSPSFALKNDSTNLHNGKFSTFGLDLKAFATYPLTDSQFIRAHAGALLWDNEFEFVSGTSGDTSLGKSSNTEFSPLYGLGYGYAVNKHTALVLELESTEVADVTLENISLSVLVKL